MFQGLRTTIYRISDIQSAKQWYSEILRSKPYFESPSYVGYNIGGFELGLEKIKKDIPQTLSSVISYWGVTDIETEYKRLLFLGGKEHFPIQDVGEGIQLASILDPFDNPFGIIYNPIFKISEK